MAAIYLQDPTNIDKNIYYFDNEYEYDIAIKEINYYMKKMFGDDKLCITKKNGSYNVFVLRCVIRLGHNLTKIDFSYNNEQIFSVDFSCNALSMTLLNNKICIKSLIDIDEKEIINDIKNKKTICMYECVTTNCCNKICFIRTYKYF
jgi:hypothetical protein